MKEYKTGPTPAEALAKPLIEEIEAIEREVKLLDRKDLDHRAERMLKDRQERFYKDAENARTSIVYETVRIARFPENIQERLIEVLRFEINTLESTRDTLKIFRDNAADRGVISWC